MEGGKWYWLKGTRNELPPERLYHLEGSPIALLRHRPPPDEHHRAVRS